MQAYMCTELCNIHRRYYMPQNYITLIADTTCPMCEACSIFICKKGIFLLKSTTCIWVWRKPTMCWNASLCIFYN
jgi:MinD superfamily P-loop ATPase